MFVATFELENSLYVFGKTVKRETEFYFIVKAVSFSQSLVEVALDWFQQNSPLCVSLEVLLERRCWGRCTLSKCWHKHSSGSFLVALCWNPRHSRRNWWLQDGSPWLNARLSQWASDLLKCALFGSWCWFCIFNVAV